MLLHKRHGRQGNQWVSNHLLVSWSELPQPDVYRQALASALNPRLTG